MTADNVIDINTRRGDANRVYLSLPGHVAGSGALPFIGLASDGNRYWCKRINSPHEREATINEVVASIVGSRIGANVRPWKIIYVPDSLKGTIMGDGTSRYRLDGLPLFGSLDLHTAEVEVEPASVPYVHDDGNHNHVPKLIAFWELCCVQVDLQIMIDRNNDNELWSIDHGFWFDSHPYPWQLTPAEQSGGASNIPLLRDEIPKVSWDKAITALGNLDESLYVEVHGAFPDEWAVSKEESDQLVGYVLDRIDHTKAKLERYRDNKRR